MICEGLFGHVLEELLAKGNAHDVDRYEKYLKPLFPERLKRFYAEYVVREAPLVPAWKSYGCIMTCLKKITAYSGGEELAREIAAQWRKTFPSMDLIHALDRAGF
ncbi:MAG: hypothetical protein LUD50_02620 [Clostridia bacterium]|nr:hypothetical protein [Clostridia bacterium]